MIGRTHMFAAMLASVGALAWTCGGGCTSALHVERLGQCPVGLYRLQSTGERYVSELAAALPPEPLAAFLADGNYLPRGVPMLKHVVALPG